MIPNLDQRTNRPKYGWGPRAMNLKAQKNNSPNLHLAGKFHPILSEYLTLSHLSTPLPQTLIPEY